MRTQFYLVAYGYDCPQVFPGIKEARAALREAVKAEKAACKRRFGCAFVKWCGDSATILVGDNAQAFNLWGAFSVVQA